MNEIWKDINGYEGLYQISDKGRIKSLAKDRGFYQQSENILSGYLDKQGYRRIDLWKNGSVKRFGVHRLIAESFIPNPESKPQVNHIDEDKDNNCVENLEWCTSKENNNWGTRTERSAQARLHRNGFIVNQYSLDGRYIKTYPSVNEIMRDLGLTSKTSLIRAINNYPQHQAYGYRWERIK